MKTISPHRRRRAPTARLAGLLAAVLLVAAALVWRAPLAGFLWRGVAPVMAWREELSAGQTAGLRAQLASTTALIADRNALSAENVLLKEQLGRAAAAPSVVALVLERPPQTPYDSLLLDAGRGSGISRGDLVYAGGTVLVGRVSEVYPTTARASLFSSPGQTYQALIGGTVPVSMTGQGAGSMTGEVPAQTSVAVGEPVLYPAITGGFVGTVSRVDVPSGESFETVYVQLPVDLFSLRYVRVASSTGS